MRSTRSLAAGVIGAAFLSLLTTSPLSAATFTFATPTGSNITGTGPVSASATITTGMNTITVALSDLLANPSDAGQLVSDLFFTYSGGPLGAPSLTTSSGQEITVASNGTFTLGSTVATGWGVSASGSTVHLDGLNQPTSPTHTIIGPPGAGGTYSSANPSIAGNGPHNPFLNQTANFVIALTGISPTTSITSAIFSFGTTSGVNIAGVPSAVPLPGALPLFATGLGGLALMRWKRKRRAQAAVA